MNVEQLDELMQELAPKFVETQEVTPELMALLFVDDYYATSPDLEYVSIEGNVVKYTFPRFGEVEDAFVGKTLVFTITFE